MSVNEDTLQGLKEALEYAKGDKTKCRAMTVSIPDDEIEMNQIFLKKFDSLSKPNKQKVMNFVNELTQAPNYK